MPLTRFSPGSSKQFLINTHNMKLCLKGKSLINRVTSKMKSIQKSSELCQIRPEPPPSLTFRRRSKSMSRRPSVKGLRFKLLYNFDKLIFALSFSKIIVKKTSIKSDKSFNIYTIAETHFALNCGHRPKLSVASQEDAQKPE